MKKKYLKLECKNCVSYIFPLAGLQVVDTYMKPNKGRETDLKIA